MKNYETISVVDNDTMLLDQHSFWNFDLIKQINLTNEIFIIPDSKVEFNKNSKYLKFRLSPDFY